MRQDGFILALAHARQNFHHSFIDPETLMVIRLNGNWDPVRIDVQTREEKLGRLRKANVWWRRGLKWFRELGLERVHADDDE